MLRVWTKLQNNTKILCKKHTDEAIVVIFHFTEESQHSDPSCNANTYTLRGTKMACDTGQFVELNGKQVKELKMI